MLNQKLYTMQVTFPKDCGNAPRKTFLKDFHLALAKGDLNFLEQHIEDKFSWELIGKNSMETKQKYLQEVQQHAHWKVENLTIVSIITHGNDAAVYGKFTTAGNKKFRFCDLYTFKGSKGFMIKSIKCFLIKEEN